MQPQPPARTRTARRIVGLFLMLLAPASPQSPAPSTEPAHAIRYTAGLLGVQDALRELTQMNQSGLADDHARIRHLEVSQRLQNAILSAVLAVDATKANIDYEMARMQEVQAILSARRDRRTNFANTANLLVGTGVGAIGSGLQLPSNTGRAGNILSTVAGAGATVFSIFAIREQRGGARTVGFTPSMLAQILGRPTPEGSEYPAMVWSYLNSPDPNLALGRTWRLHLIGEWKAAGRLPADIDPNSQRVQELTSSGRNGVPLGIDTLADRIAMLADVRAHVSRMEVDLSAFMQYLVSVAP